MISWLLSFTLILSQLVYANPDIGFRLPSNTHTLSSPSTIEDAEDQIPDPSRRAFLGTAAKASGFVVALLALPWNLLADEPTSLEGNIGSAPEWGVQWLQFKNPQNLSKFDRLIIRVSIAEGEKGKVLVRLQDARTRDDQMGALLMQAFPVVNGKDIVIPLSEFRSLRVDLTRIQRISIHFGRDAWGIPINPSGSAPVSLQEILVSESTSAVQSKPAAQQQPQQQQQTPKTKTTQTTPSKRTYPPNEIPLRQKRIEVKASQLLRNGQPYVIRGVTLGFVPDGMDRLTAELKLYNVGEENIRLMAAAGINTVRTYNAPTKDLLDAFARHGIMVIVGIPNYDDRQVRHKVDIQNGSYLDYIRRFKNHEAILMWEFGNEYNYHPEWFGGNVENWYQILEKASAAAKRNDPSHPVSSAYGELVPSSLVKRMKHVDIWGINVYRGNNFGGLFEQWQRENSGKAMYLSEYGNNQSASEQAQAQTARSLWPELADAINNKQTVGGTWMAWRNEKWKRGGPAENNLGIVKGSPAGAIPKPAYKVFQDAWTKILVFVIGALTALGFKLPAKAQALYEEPLAPDEIVTAQPIPPRQAELVFGPDEDLLPEPALAPLEQSI